MDKKTWSRIEDFRDMLVIMYDSGRQARAARPTGRSTSGRILVPGT